MLSQRELSEELSQPLRVDMLCDVNLVCQLPDSFSISIVFEFTDRIPGPQATEERSQDPGRDVLTVAIVEVATLNNRVVKGLVRLSARLTVCWRIICIRVVVLFWLLR